MMADATYVILAGRQQWQLAVETDSQLREAPLPASGDRLDAETAAAIREEMLAVGYRGEPVVLAIPSSWALAASVPTENLPRRNRRQALLYRLEEQLPLPAEDLVADFVEAGNTALGVAAETGRLAGIVDALEAAGITVQVVSPTAILALQGLAAERDYPGHCHVVAAVDGHVELAGFDSRRISSWQSLPSDPAEVRRAVQAELLLGGAAGSLVSVGLNGQFRSALADLGELEVDERDGADWGRATLAGAGEALRGRNGAWFNLRRGALGVADSLRLVRRPLVACLGLAVLMLCCMVAGLLWRAQRYGDATERFQAKQQELFDDMLPGQPAVGSVHRRLQSELRKVSGLRLISTEVPQRVCSLDVLHETVIRLPGNLRFRILDIQIEPTRLVIEGQARSHGDAETIAAELRKGGLLAVDPPRTERLVRGGVAFTLTARLLRPPGKDTAR